MVFVSFVSQSLEDPFCLLEAYEPASVVRVADTIEPGLLLLPAASPGLEAVAGSVIVVVLVVVLVPFGQSSPVPVGPVEDGLLPPAVLPEPEAVAGSVIVVVLVVVSWRYCYRRRRRYDITASSAIWAIVSCAGTMVRIWGSCGRWVVAASGAA
nr:hypothetical protein L204_05005 [Cryptococcus depauperatus CBS 7855]